MTQIIRNRVLMSSVFAAIFAYANASTSTDLLSLSIRAEKDVVKTSSEVRVRVTIINNSDKVVNITMSNPVFNYNIKVSRTDGKFVNETDLMRRLKNLSHGVGMLYRMSGAILKPREKTHDLVNVGDLYDLNEPGDYSIQIEKNLPEELGHGVIKSNIITVTETP